MRKTVATGGTSHDFSIPYSPGDEIILVQEIPGGKIPGSGSGYRGSAKINPPTTIGKFSLHDLLQQGRHPQLVKNLADKVVILARELINEGVITKGQI